MARHGERQDRRHEPRPPAPRGAEPELPAEARALLDAVVAIGSDLDLCSVLRRIVVSACELTGAEYGVLAIVDEHGTFTDLVSHGMTDEQIAAIATLPVGHGVLGTVPQQRRALRLEHLHEHEDSVGFPSEHPPIDAFLGAPVLVGDRTFGHLYLGSRPGAEPFTAGDESLVTALARGAGVVIGHARAFAESESRRTWLEATVKVAAALAPTVHLDDATGRLVEAVQEASAAPLVALVTRDDELLEVAACAGDLAEALALTRRGEVAGRIRLAAETGEMFRIAQDSGLSTLVIPLRTQLAAPGVLIVDGAAAWSSDRGLEAELLEAFAKQAGLALDRAHAIDERHELLLAKDRDRIARDLHDLVIQRLFATGLQLQSLRSQSSLDEAQAGIADAVAEIDHTIKDLRSTIFALGRGNGSVREEVRTLIDQYAAVLGFLPSLRTTGPVDVVLPPRMVEQLLLVLREALSNVARHARATSVAVELRAFDDWFVLAVTDDGIGLAGEAFPGGHGLGNLRHRAEALGGHMRVTPVDPHGTRLEWIIPTVR